MLPKVHTHFAGDTLHEHAAPKRPSSYNVLRCSLSTSADRTRKCMQEAWHACMTNLMKVSLHELKDDVYVLELPWTRRQHDVLDLHDICRYSRVTLQFASATNS